MSKKPDIYTLDGVNVEEGDKFSKYAGALCRSTYENSPYVEVRDFSLGHFRGPRGYRFKNLPPDCFEDAAPDGDGTKVVITDAAFNYLQGARGVVAMTNGDITRWGGLPLVFVNVLDTKTLDESGTETNNAFRQLLAGLKQAADDQGFVMYKGETAELPGCVGSDNPKARAVYNWAGTAIGVYDPKRVITGDDLRPGQLVLAGREVGFRNNGISSVRKAFEMHFGSDWFTHPDAQAFIREAAKPAVLYDKFLATVNGWYDDHFKPVVELKLIVHLTGGSYKGKLWKDILMPRGLSAELSNLWDLPPIMRQCAHWRGMDSRAIYETWNGGQGILMVVETKEEAFRLIEIGRLFGIEIQVCGSIAKSLEPTLVVHSKFDGEKLFWPDRK